MKKIALKYGSLGGLVMVVLIMIPHWILGVPGKDYNFTTGEVLGYAAMILSLLGIFLGVKSYRDKQLNGIISFKKAFSAGLLINGIASFIFGLYTFFLFEFIMGDEYVESIYNYYVDQIQKSGASQDEIALQMGQMESMKGMMANGVFQGVVMFFTVFLIGLLIALLSAAILKKQSHQPVKTE